MRRRLQPSAPLLALLAVVAVAGVTWAFVVPAWEVADEPQHFSYVETLFHEHHLPGRGPGNQYAGDLYRALAVTNFNAPIVLPNAVPEWSHLKGAIGKRQMSAGSRDTGGGSTEAASNPPLYYLFDLPVYALFSGAPTTTALYAMRVWNVLILLVGAVAGWVLVGELVGRLRLAQLAGAATVGLWPMATFLTPALNPDGMLFAAWTVVFALGARVARRGLTVGRGLALGVAVGVACLVKATSFALIPGTLALLAWGLWLRRRELPWPSLLRLGAAAGAAAVVLPLAWALYSRSTGAAAFAQVSGATGGGSGVDLRQFASYLWQFYLPKLGFMNPRIEFLYPIVSHRPVLNTWLASGTATLGWANVWFAPWVYWAVGWTIVGVGAIAAAGAVVRRRGGHRPARGVIAGVAFVVAGAVGIAAGTHWTDFNFYRTGGMPFAQGRYILPGALPALALIVAAAVAGAGRWRGVVAGAVIGALLVLQVVSVGLVVDRWYVA